MDADEDGVGGVVADGVAVVDGDVVGVAVVDGVVDGVVVGKRAGMNLLTEPPIFHVHNGFNRYANVSYSRQVVGRIMDECGQTDANWWARIDDDELSAQR